MCIRDSVPHDPHLGQPAGDHLQPHRDCLLYTSSVRTAVFDTLAALLAGLAIMPAVFAYGIDAASGPSLMLSLIHI